MHVSVEQIEAKINDDNSAISCIEDSASRINFAQVRSLSLMIAHTTAMILAENHSYIDAFDIAYNTYKKFANHITHIATEDDTNELNQLWQLTCSLAIDCSKALVKQGKIQSLSMILKEMALSRMFQLFHFCFFVMIVCLVDLKFCLLFDDIQYILTALCFDSNYVASAIQTLINKKMDNIAIQLISIYVTKFGQTPLIMICYCKLLHHACSQVPGKKNLALRLFQQLIETIPESKFSHNHTMEQLSSKIKLENSNIDNENGDVSTVLTQITFNSDATKNVIEIQPSIDNLKNKWKDKHISAMYYTATNISADLFTNHENLACCQWLYSVILLVRQECLINYLKSLTMGLLAVELKT